MAEAYGKLTGKPGVLLVTRGPGACNASIGIHTAFQDSTPMVVLVGQVARHQLDREAFQEVDFRKMFAPLAKWVAQIDLAERVPGARYLRTTGTLNLEIGRLPGSELPGLVERGLVRAMGEDEVVATMNP